MSDETSPSGMIIVTAFASLATGFMFGIFATRGYFISPELVEERRRNLKDPVESDESDIDEDDTLMDHAPNWANGEDADRRQGLKLAAEKKARAEVVDHGEECKLVLCVRTDLGMTKGMFNPQPRNAPANNPGKIAAQASHATLACYKRLARSSNPQERAILARWENLGQAKIALQVKGQADLLELQAKARSLGLTAETIQDAGRTQIEAGSMTVLGVGPAPRSLVDQVTGHLKLL